MLRLALIIGFGGFIGTLARYFSMLWIQRISHISFPFGTMFVNLIGCFLIGLFYGMAYRYNWFANDLRLFLTVGFCGGFTTFSTFTADSLALLRDGQIMYVSIYISASVVIGIAFTFLGYSLIKLL
jgi:CrcB protein